ncbi:unnamed protein product [Oikopleura dioica]|uniref:Uncharacterized protein n=1 Tax=Oikopleura dioica TaxID=34765 RepID=E4X1I4_OIKDI|nr:unnamed protein product [Oikopleura dioica]
MSSDEENHIPEVDHLIMVIGIVVGVFALFGHFGLFIASCLMAVPEKHRGFKRIGFFWIFLALLGLIYKVFAAAYVSLPSENYEFVFTIVDKEIIGTAGLVIQWSLTGVYILCYALGCVLVISQATALRNAVRGTKIDKNHKHFLEKC